MRPNILALLPDATQEQLESFITEILNISYLERNIPDSFKFERDPKDEIIINLAIFSKADFVVTRDKDLLDLMTDISIAGKQFRQKSRLLKIVEPIEFLKIISRNELTLNP